MFDLFKNMGAMAGALRNLPRLQEQMGQLQARLAQVVVTGTAAGGLVTARVNGRLEVVGVSISNQAMQLQDREMLEDLIRSAVNQALNRARETLAEETAKLGESLGLPPGMKLPGFS